MGELCPRMSDEDDFDIVTVAEVKVVIGDGYGAEGQVMGKELTEEAQAGVARSNHVPGVHSLF